MYNISIKFIIVQTDYGVPFLELGTGELSVDGSLIGGLSSAISSMWSHFVEKDQYGFEIIEQRGTCIIVHRKRLSSLIVIAENYPSDPIQRRIRRAHTEIEEKFKPIIEANDRGKFTELPREEVIEIFQRLDLPIAFSKNDIK